MTIDTIDAVMEMALEQASRCEPVESAYNVGAVLVNASLTKDDILSQHYASHQLLTGYSRELPGNTHAEQVCFLKFDALHVVTTAKYVLYTTMEPCSTRLSGNITCTQNILDRRDVLQIIKVVVACKEPPNFVSKVTGLKTLEQAGISISFLSQYEQDALDKNAHLLKEK